MVSNYIENFFAEDVKKFFDMFRQDGRNMNEYIKYSLVRFSDKMDKKSLRYGLSYALNSVYGDEYNRYFVFINGSKVEVCHVTYDDEGYENDYATWVAYEA